LLGELWETLGLADLIRRALRSSRRGFDVEAAVRLMVFNRLCDPDSKLGLLRWLERVVVCRGSIRRPSRTSTCCGPWMH
jgi:hypothetical protein